MIRNKRHAGWASVLAVLLMIQCAGCSGNQGSSDAGQNGNSPAGDNELSETSDKDAVTDNAVDGSKEEKKRAVPLTDEQKKAAEEAGISEERYCTDNTEITKTAEGLLTQYCEGMMEADHDKCFGAFPAFYKKAVEKENSDCGDTDEQYMQSLKKGFEDSYGDDFYLFATVNSVLQLSDESLVNTESRLKESFGEDIVLDDLYYVYFTETVRGSKNKSSDALEFYIPVIDGKCYLYDDYYEVTAEEETVPQPDVSEEKNEPEVTEAAGDAKVSETEK